MIIYILILVFAAFKGVILATGKNPNISVVRESNSFAAEERINLNEINYRLAFVVESYLERANKNDSKYIKYIA